ncbi:MAG: hypothetical protein ACOCZR_00805 [Halanaerobiales bacterium]
MRGQVKEITDKIYDGGRFGLSYAEIEKIVEDVKKNIKEEVE